jgi:nitrite reductase/ring-hydroxylating ferredoxin subunit
MGSAVPNRRGRSTRRGEFVRAGSVEELQERGRRVVTVGGTPVLVLWHEGRFHALDNRCPHMGFPMSRGDVKDGLLDCHWHHARFDISCGATLDPWADDLDPYRTEVRDGAVWVDPERPQRDPREHGLARLRRGLDDNLNLVLNKAVIELLEARVPPSEPAGVAALHGARERAGGWQPGLSILTAMLNVLPALDPIDRQRALCHAVRHVAADCAGRPPRRPLAPLDGSDRPTDGLSRWLRETVEVRDSDGSERTLATLAAHGDEAALHAVLVACTDHRYADVGHALDYALKCAELVDHLDPGPCERALLFTSLVGSLTTMQRMEETAAWRRPVDVASLVDAAAADLPADAFEGPVDEVLPDEDELVEALLADDPSGAIDGLTGRLRGGASPIALAEAVVTAATRRILHFGTVNETTDWDTVHHTLTYASAVAQGMRRVPSADLFRGVLDAAMSVYLDRFLNVPAAKLPAAGAAGSLDELLVLYDRRSTPDQVGAFAWSFLEGGGAPEDLLRTLGHAVLREDSGFHAYQQLDLAWRRLQRRGDGRTARLALVACARWLAAQYPTRRARDQTFGIARRLHHGESLQSS